MVNCVGSKRKITLSPFGRLKESYPQKEKTVFTKSAGSEEAKTSVTQEFDWPNALIDAAIIAAVSFFATLGGVTVVGANIQSTLISAAIAGAAQFFVMLAMKRGLKTK